MINKNLANLTLLVFICFFFVSSRIGLAMAGNKTIPVNVGVVLDDLDSMEGKAWLSSIEMALSDFYASHSHYKTRLVLNVRDSNENVVGAAAAGRFSHLILTSSRVSSSNYHLPSVFIIYFFGGQITSPSQFLFDCKK